MEEFISAGFESFSDDFGIFYLVWKGRYPERATLLVFMYAFAVIIYAFPCRKGYKGHIAITPSKSSHIAYLKIKNVLVAVILVFLVVSGLYQSRFGI